MATVASLVAIPLPPPPATLVLIVDMFQVQDPETIVDTRRRLALLGYQTCLVLASTDAVEVTHDGTPCAPIAARFVSCPATGPHDQCRLCSGTGMVQSL